MQRKSSFRERRSALCCAPRRHDCPTTSGLLPASLGHKNLTCMSRWLELQDVPLSAATPMLHCKLRVSRRLLLSFSHLIRRPGRHAILTSLAGRPRETQDVGPSWETCSLPHSRSTILYRAKKEWKCDRGDRGSHCACTVPQPFRQSHKSGITGARDVGDVGVRQPEFPASHNCVYVYC